MKAALIATGLAAGMATMVALGVQVALWLDAWHRGAGFAFLCMGVFGGFWWMIYRVVKRAS